MTLNPGLTTELQKLAPSAVIELFELDCTPLGGDLLRFHAGTNGLSQNIVWNGHTYTRYPVQVTGYEYTGQGQFPRPKLAVSNLFSAITLINMTYRDLLGSKVTRIRTMMKYLDAVNFAGGVNPTADPTAAFEPDVYFIDRKSNEDRDVVEFELASSIDVAGIRLPRRQIVQNVCPWIYRGAECGYAGPPAYDANDQRITTATTTQGLAVVNTYTAFLAAELDLKNKEAALSAAAQARDSACAYQKLGSYFNFTPPTGTAHPTPTNGVVWDGFSGAITAYRAGVAVSLGTTYVQGAFQQTYSNGYIDFKLYAIEEWGIGGTCSTATSAYSTALTARNSAQTAYNSAVTAYQAALASLPAGDPLYTAEQCGKRLSSCKLRFGENAELSFGSFPSVGLFR